MDNVTSIPHRDALFFINKADIDQIRANIAANPYSNEWKTLASLTQINILSICKGAQQ